jgi:hypothetical protein
MASTDRVPRPYRGADRAAPAGVQGGQYVAELPEDTVTVFLIGMRVNRWRKVRSWWPTFAGMSRMLRELQARPDLGLLRARSYWSGRKFLTLQYWRSAEHLGRYARDPGRGRRTPVHDRIGVEDPEYVDTT